MEEGKKKKAPKDEEPDPGPKLASAGAWILYPLTGGLHIDVKCRLVCYCELALSLFFIVIGFSNIVTLDELVVGYIQIINGVFLLCLFLEVFYGFRYRSPALLYLHTVQCVFVAFMIAMGLIFGLIQLNQDEVSGTPIRTTISDLQSTAISYTIILLTLGLASWARARDLLKMHRELPRHALNVVTRRLRQTAGIVPE